MFVFHEIFTEGDSKREELSKENDHKKKLKKDSFAYIRNFSTGKWLHCETKAESIEEMGNDKDLRNIGLVLIPELSDNIYEESSFRIYKATSNEVYETDFLISCFPIFKSYSQAIMKAYYVIHYLVIIYINIVKIQ